MPVKVLKIALEELPGDVPGWFKNVLEVLNPWLASVSSALNGNSAVYKEISFLTETSVEDTWPIVVKNPLNTVPKCVSIAKMREEGAGGAKPGVSLWWEMRENDILVTPGGLEDLPGVRFYLTLKIE